MKRKERTIVSAVLVSKDQKILLGKIRHGGVYPGCWHLPGGGVDEGENRTIALNREVKEEVGLEIAHLPTKLLSDSDSDETTKADKITGEIFLVKMYFNVYRVDLDLDSKKIKISLNDDLKEYQWVPIKNLGQYKLTPPSKKLFKNLGWI